MLGRGSHINQTNKISGSTSRVFSRVLSGHKGYTITEVMIFLAVTTGIFVMVASTFSQRQRSTEFNTAAREIESQVQDIANDITTGFYGSTESFGCNTTGPLSDRVPNITPAPPGGGQQGTNQDCILVGRAIHFVGASAGESYNVYSVAGARRTSVSSDERDVENYNEANPRAITISGMVETKQVPRGLTIRGMRIGGGGGTSINGVGFFTTFGAAASANPTALSVNLIPLTGSTSANMESAINSVSDTTPMNPARGVVVCMDDSGTNQRALLRIGTQNSRLTTEVVMESGTCAAAGF
ncbi:hypothetical protein KC968_02200 [Candidatus Saccharibacteria bacterium]|nr:hypothetical protein [Candidatus Saccharibacteria bacterium]